MADDSIEFEAGMDAFVNGDSHKALEKWKPLAERGYARAQSQLGEMYLTGDVVTKDDRKAVNWFRLAAEQGLTEAQYNLGFVYYKGEGVSQDYNEAIKWFRLAAEKGFIDAQWTLGEVYFEGNVVPKNYVQAHFWNNIAGTQWFNIVRGRRGIDGVTEWRNTLEKIEKHMTPAQIGEAERLANEWMEKHRKK